MSLYYDWLKKLENNAQQREALERNSSTVVIAGPGTGKTRILALKVAKLLKEEIASPQGIACLTYTNMMAKELEERLTLLGISNRPNINVSTVHSFCLSQIIKPFNQSLNLGIPTPIRIAPDRLQKQLFNEAVQITGGINENNGLWRKFLKTRSKIIDTPPARWRNNEDVGKVTKCYEDLLIERNYVDFDMIIKTSLFALRKEDVIRQCLSAKYPWFAIDEYQDLGYPLNLIVKEFMTNTNIKFFIIGDPSQSIYDFSGTDPKYLIELSNQENIKPTIELEINYRSTQEIIDLSNLIIAKKRPLRTELLGGKCRLINCSNGFYQQMDEVVKLIKKYTQTGVSPNDIAVFHKYRDNCNSGLDYIAQKFYSENIPYTIDKNEHYNRKCMIINWLENLGNYWLRGWEKPEESKKHINFDEIILNWKKFGSSEKLPFRADTNFARIYFTEIIWKNKCNANTLLHEWLILVDKSFDLSALFEEFKNDYPDDVDDYHNLIKQTTKGYPLEKLTLAQFCNLYPSIQLTTLHSCKGTEFAIVIITGIEDIGESKNARRLFYVGVTRAKKELHLFYSKKKPFSKAREKMTPKFIQEILDAKYQKNWKFITVVNI